jgi:5-(carboxyamino)imidazole ribonucleotide mutase
VKKASTAKSIGKPLVGIVMGSESDYETMKNAEDILKDFGVRYEISVVSAHRTPKVMYDYATTAQDRGLKVIIAGAGGAAHLPGMISALTTLPVLGVPVQSKALNGLDSLLSIVQMPGGVPTATFAIGASGATNAGLFAVQILALQDDNLADALSRFREKKAKDALAGNSKVRARLQNGSDDGDYAETRLGTGKNQRKDAPSGNTKGRTKSNSGTRK